MKGFLLPDSMAFYTCPALEIDNRARERAFVNSILDLEIPQKLWNAGQERTSYIFDSGK